MATDRTDPRQLLEQMRGLAAEAAKAGDVPRLRQLLESMWLWDEWSFGGSDLWDRLRPRSQDDPGGPWVPPSVPSDRRHGARWPVWRTQTELDEYRAEARVRLASNSYAEGLLENLVNNVVGKGFSYAAESRTEDGAEPTPEQEKAARQVQQVLAEFLDANDWNGDADNDSDEAVSASCEREVYARVKGDGEAFLRLYYVDGGRTLVRFVEPEQVRGGHDGDTPQDGWSYGIRHQMDPFEDVKTPLEYAVFWMDPTAPGGGESRGTWEFVPAKEMVHVKGYKTPATVKRGLSSFLFDTGRALDRAAKVQRNASIGAAIRAATAEIWQHATATQASVSSLAGALSGGLTITDQQTGIQTPVEKILAGTVRRIPQGQTLVPNPPDQSESYLMAGQGDLRQAAAAHCAPEFWMAETSSGNYSNLESAAAPAVRAGQAEQEYFKRAFRRMLWKAVAWAAECGRLPADVRKLVRIKVEAPAVLHRNELEKAQEDQIGVQNGWKDRETCAGERGLDWPTVSRRNREYQEQQGPQGPPLGLPGEGDGPPKPTPPGGGGKGPIEGRVREGAPDPSLLDPPLKEGEEKGGQFKRGRKMPRVVRAKRAGWDEKLTDAQLLDADPYEHEGDDDLCGELEVVDGEVPGVGPIKVYLVAGQEADPKTIRDADEPAAG